MLVHLQSFAHLRVSRMVPAFPLVVLATGGHAQVRRRGFVRTLLPGQHTIVPALEHIDLHLEGSAYQEASCTLEIADNAKPSHTSSLRHWISQQVFLQPAHTWNAAFVSDVLHTSALHVRRSLFSEGATLTEICRTQRLMRLLFEILNGDLPTAQVRTHAVWPPSGDLDSSFYDWFGLSLQSAHYIAQRRHWGLHPTSHGYAQVAKTRPSARQDPELWRGRCRDGDAPAPPHQPTSF